MQLQTVSASISLGEAGGSPTPTAPRPLKLCWVRWDSNRDRLKQVIVEYTSYQQWHVPQHKAQQAEKVSLVIGQIIGGKAAAGIGNAFVVPLWDQSEVWREEFLQCVTISITGHLWQKHPQMRKQQTAQAQTDHGGMVNADDQLLTSPEIHRKMLEAFHRAKLHQLGEEDSQTLLQMTLRILVRK